MHEMPMTTAPMRPTVPALRPFVEMPVVTPDSGSVARFVLLISGLLLRRGCAGRRSSGRAARAASSLPWSQEQSARLRQPAGADEDDLAGEPGEMRDGILDAVARCLLDDGGRGRRAAARARSASTSSRARRRRRGSRRCRGPAGTSNGTSETSRRSTSAVAGEGDGLVEQRVGAGARADRDRDARDDGIVLLRGADRSERDRDGRRVQQLGGDAAEPVATEDAAAGRADHDHARRRTPHRRR